MNSAEILNGLLDNESIWEGSPAVNKKISLFTEMYDTLCETLTAEQCEFLSDVDYIGSVLQKDVFKDGVIFGMKLSRDLSRLLENPEMAYSELCKSRQNAEAVNARGIEAKKNFEKSVIEMKNQNAQKLAAQI